MEIFSSFAGGVATTLAIEFILSILFVLWACLKMGKQGDGDNGSK